MDVPQSKSNLPHAFLECFTYSTPFLLDFDKDGEISMKFTQIPQFDNNPYKSWSAISINTHQPMVAHSFPKTLAPIVALKVIRVASRSWCWASVKNLEVGRCYFIGCSEMLSYKGIHWNMPSISEFYAYIVYTKSQLKPVKLDDVEKQPYWEDYFVIQVCPFWRKWRSWNWQL